MATDLLRTYLRWRRFFEVGFWFVAIVVNTLFNTGVAAIELERMGHSSAFRVASALEWSSTLMWFLLVPAIIAFEHRVPLHFGVLRRNLPWHVLASLAASMIHVGGMFGLRMAIWASHGAVYDVGDLPRELVYEYLKDARSYTFILLIVLSYRLLILRLQGEARLLEAPDAGAPIEPVERPERFLVRKLGKEFLLPASEIEWLQAMGNYVNLRVRGRDYPLRSTMAAIESRLEPSRFARVHRSYIVNLDQVAEIEPTEGGDARIRMKDGSVVPCSRRHRDALRGHTLSGNSP